MMQITPPPVVKTFANLLLLLLGPYFLAPGTGFAQWEPDRRLTFNDSSSLYPCVASGPQSTVHVAWDDDRQWYRYIYYKRSTDNGITWSPDTTYYPDNSHSLNPSISSSGSYIHLIFEGGSWDWICYGRSTDNGATWTPKRVISDTAFLLDAQYPKIAAAGSSVHVVWQDDRDGNTEIYYKRSTDNGISWSPDTRLTFEPNHSQYPQVAVSGAGVHIIWRDDRDRVGDLYYKRSTDNGSTWSSDTQLTTTGISNDPAFAVSGSVVHAVWGGVYYMRSTDAGVTWSGISHLTISGSTPSITTTGSNVHLVWMSYTSPHYYIYYKRSFDSGVTWALDECLTDTSAYATRPAIATSGTAVHVVWQDDRNRYNYPEIYYKRNPTGNIGVERETGQGSKVRDQGYTLTPNPFTSFATLPGREADRFTLYDVSGRKVGVYRGDRIGEGLAPGVYFLRAECGKAKPLRVVKVK